MTTSIARQSVIIKCNLGKSVLLGNYELYYAGGLMNNLFKLSANQDMTPIELTEYLQEQEKTIEPKDEKEKYLLHLIENFEPLPDYDEQMKELFRWGETEKDLWKVVTSRVSA